MWLDEVVGGLENVNNDNKGSNIARNVTQESRNLKI